MTEGTNWSTFNTRLFFLCNIDVLWALICQRPYFEHIFAPPSGLHNLFISRNKDIFYTKHIPPNKMGMYLKIKAAG